MIGKKRILLPAVLVVAVLLIALVLLFTVVLPRVSPVHPNLVDSSSIHVNPVDGLSPDFIMGADISMLAQIEQFDRRPAGRHGPIPPSETSP